MKTPDKLSTFVKTGVSRFAPYFLICIVVSAIHVFGLFWPADRLLFDASFRMFDRPATGNVVIIAFDPRSLERLNVWPWPRSVHAKAIDTLIKSGANEIGYDVDFSSPSDPIQDARLATSLADAGNKVILPAFRQRSSTREGPLAIKETWPLPVFRGSAQLGSVTFRPAPDGLIREMSVTSPGIGEDIPAMSALLAGPSALRESRFYVDFGIDITTVPRYSLIDLIEGRVPASDIEGKKVLVGAAATELGDQHAVPIYNRLHGVELQALAFESLVQGRALNPVRPLVVVAGLILLTLMIGARLEPLRWQESFVIGSCVIFIVLLAGIVAQGVGGVVIPTFAMALLVAVIVVFSAYRDLWTMATLMFRQRMNLIHQGAFIREVLENSFDGVIVTDTEGTVVVHNQSAPSLLKVSAETMIGSPITNFLPKNEASRLMSMPPHVWNGPAIEREVEVVKITCLPSFERYLEFQRGQFYRRVSRSNRSERRDIDRPFYTYTFRDVTERVNREAIQRAATVQAQEENRVKSEVMATMSHELRTPLNAILGFSEVMKREEFGPIDAIYKAYSENIYDSGKHLLTLIDEVLDVACIESGRFTLNEKLFDVAAAVKQSILILEVTAESSHRNLRVQIEGKLGLLSGDARLIKQCIINVVSNSIKFTPAGGNIDVIAGIDARGDLEIVVEDTGIGIREDQIEMIRRPFYRGNAISSEVAGSVGLGLSLVDAYMRIHDGRLEISSQIGRGTTVRMIFPSTRIISVPEADVITDTEMRGSNVVGFKKS